MNLIVINALACESDQKPFVGWKNCMPSGAEFLGVQVSRMRRSTAVLTDTNAPRTSPIKVRNDLTSGDLSASLSAGWSDFREHPAYGLFFAAIFALAGAFLTYVTAMRGEMTWLIPAAAGFPLIAPFAAVGLYEVSRRRELGIAMTWGAILGAVRGRGDGQILSMGVIIFVAFGFWVIVAHVIASIALVEAGSGSESLAFFVSQPGMLMLLIGSIVGAVMALAFYSITVISLPMLVDREVDFITAIIASLRTVRKNTFVMLVWAALIATLLFASMLPAFLGLFVVLPVLGHATWHLYRRAIN